MFQPHTCLSNDLSLEVLLSFPLTSLLVLRVAELGPPPVSADLLLGLAGGPYISEPACLNFLMLLISFTSLSSLLTVQDSSLHLRTDKFIGWAIPKFEKAGSISKFTWLEDSSHVLQYLLYRQYVTAIFSSLYSSHLPDSYV